MTKPSAVRELRKSLRIELQGRVTLFSDAAHHLNNPLNHIDGAKRSIRRQSHELESVVMELVTEDDGVEEVQTYLKERFENIVEQTTSLKMPFCVPRGL